MGPYQNTQNPILGGASVVGLVFDGGVILASDNLSSYGSMARYRNCQRVNKVNKDVIVGYSGDLADYQHVWKLIEQKTIEDESRMEGKNIGPVALHTWLTRLHYNKRNDFDPYWIEWVVGGMQDGKPFLGYVDKLGTSFQEKAIGSGRFGVMAVTLLREYTDNFSAQLNEQKARELVLKTLEVLYYCDAYTTYKYHLAIITKDKEAVVEGPFELKTNWQSAYLVDEIVKNKHY